MYGYLKPDNTALEFVARRYYRERYCSLCHSLWNYYGMLPRMFLSYDVTFATVLLDLDSQVNFNTDKILCYRKNRIVSNQEEWKKISAISILLAAGKLKDNIDDDNSFIAKVLLAIFSKSIKKAEQDYPELASFLTTSLKNMSDLEKANASVEQMATAFSDMMCEAYKMLFNQSEHILVIAKYVSKWVYFIDAIDDLDKDIKDRSYNPFINVAKSKRDLIDNHTEVISTFIAAQHDELQPIVHLISGDTIVEKLVYSILNDTIPKTTLDVLSGKNRHKFTSPHLKLIQSKEGIIFA